MRIILLLIVFSFCLNINAQNYDFGEVSKEELEEKYNPLDSSASATYLYKYRKTYFNYNQGQGFELITEIHERIKIYTQEGFDYATQKVALYKQGSDDESLTGLKAYTYNLINGKIEETKLKKDGVFKTEIARNWDETKFTMPDIKPGAIVEYKYKITSPYFWNVDAFVFQNDIPIKKVEARFDVPEYFNFKSSMKGYLSVVPKVETKSDKITFNYKSRSGGNGDLTTTSFSTENVEFTKIINRFNLENVPALKEEPFVNNINNYRSSIDYELSYTKFPNTPLKYYSETWEDVVKTIYKSSNFGGELSKSGYFEKDLDALIASTSDPVKRAAIIFNHVKSKVKWDGYYSKYTRDGVKKAYKQQTGNVAEINLMLTSMLRYAGLNANPVLVSTRQNGIPLFPTIEGYNYVVTAIEIQDNVILLDATSKYSAPNVLPLRALNWEGRIIRKSGSFATVNLYPLQKSKNTISLMVNLQENGDIDGKYRSVKTNHNALLYRQKFNGADEDDYLEKLENKFNGLEISNFEVTNSLDLSKPLVENYDFFKESQADIVGDKLYFSPLFYLTSDENPFKLENREFPVDFGYQFSDLYRLIVTIPDGYKIETMPEAKVLSLPDGLGKFKYQVVGNGNKITISFTNEMNLPVISALYYETLKEYYKQMIEKENEKIVLTKV